jgi:uncharacterized RDD family membrane protein YckC
MSTGKSSQFDVNHWILRFLAYIIDSIIPFIIAYVISYFAFVGLGFWGSYLLSFFLFGIIEVIYFMVMEVYYGATLGKKLFGLEVQTENGSRVTFGKSFIRNISKIFWPFLLIDWLLGIVMPGQDHRQKYTDRIAGTTVVSVKQSIFAAKPQPTSPPPPPPPPPP